MLASNVQVAYPGAELLPGIIVGGTDARFFRDRGAVAYGAGIGYYIGEVLRVGFDANHFERSSPASRQRGFHATKFGASISYGTPRTGR